MVAFRPVFTAAAVAYDDPPGILELQPEIFLRQDLLRFDVGAEIKGAHSRPDPEYRASGSCLPFNITLDDEVAPFVEKEVAPGFLDLLRGRLEPDSSYSMMMKRGYV